MRLTQRLLLGALIVVGVFVVLLVSLADRRLRDRLLDRTVDELAREATLVAEQWAHTANADSLANVTGLALRHRVTLIDSTGHVVGDSRFDGPALARLENHAHRPEVIEAHQRGVGSAGRRSASAGDDELYVAVHAGRGVARVSIETQTIDAIMEGARRDLLLAGLIALGVALVLAVVFSHSVSRPLVELSAVARAIAAGDLTRRPTLAGPGEVGDLATAVTRMAEQLHARLTALKGEESLLGAVFDSLNEGVIAFDARGGVRRINDAGRRLLGVREALPLPGDRLPRSAALRQALADALAGRATEAAELRLGAATVALTARPLPGGGAVLALFDLTAVRRLETVRRDFVANVSHELKTPLTVIGGFAETLADEELPAEQRRQFAQTIRTNTARMQRIVDDLLDLSRIESGGWLPHPEQVDVCAAALDAFAAVQPMADARGLRLECDIADDALHAWADPTALRQILGNLVENAVRYTTSGGVTVFTRREGDGVRVGVRDTGAGIPGAHLSRIFERFYRVDPARSRAEGGTGLGLAIVKHLAEAHGGDVRAESAVGQGTTISVLFPARREAPGA